MWSTILIIVGIFSLISYADEKKSEKRKEKIKKDIENKEIKFPGFSYVQYTKYNDKDLEYMSNPNWDDKILKEIIEESENPDKSNKCYYKLQINEWLYKCLVNKELGIDIKKNYDNKIEIRFATKDNKIALGKPYILKSKKNDIVGLTNDGVYVQKTDDGNFFITNIAWIIPVNNIYGAQSKQVVKEVAKEWNSECEIPIWNNYIYNAHQDIFPTQNHKSFYKYFKKNFLCGNYINIRDNYSYAFFLMYDLFNSIKNEDDLRKLLQNLAENYERTSGYCYDKIGKMGIEYNGKIYKLIKRDIYVPDNDFIYKDDIIKWLCDSDEYKSYNSRTYINIDGTIDVISNKSNKCKCIVCPISDSLPSYIQFNIVNGDFIFTNTGWNSTKNYESGYQGGQVEYHKISTLIGCPKVVNGDFNCANIGLDSLSGGPEIVDGDYIAKRNNLSSFDGMALKIGECFDVSDNELTDNAWEYAKENIQFDINNYKITKNKFFKYKKELF